MNDAIRYRDLAVLLAIAAVLAAFVVIKDRRSQPAPDGYARYGFALAEWGVYGAAKSIEQPPPPDANRPPLYPAFLAAMMEISPQYRELVADYIAGRGPSDLNAGLTPYVQLLITTSVAIFIFLIARLFGSHPAPAIIVSAVALFPIYETAYRYRISECLSIPLFAAASYLLALWFLAKHPRYWHVLLAGAVLGLLALTRTVHFYYVVPVAFAMLVVPPKNGARSLHARALAAGILTAGLLLATAPWMMRNLAVNQTATLGAGGSSGVFAMRAEYNQMTALEVLGGSIYWLPDFGDGLARAILPERAWRRFKFSNPDSFRQAGWKTRARFAEQYPDPAKRRRALMGYMFQNPFGHLVTMIPFTVRGLHHLWLFLPFAIWGGVIAVRMGEHWTILAALSLTIATFLLHIALTHFRARYGAPMVVGAAPLAALGLTYLWHEWRWRQTAPR